MRRVIRRVRVAAPAWVALLFLTASCAAGLRALRVVGECTPGILAGVLGAIRSGGSDWVPIVNAGLECVPKALSEIAVGEGATATLDETDRQALGFRMDVAGQLYRMRRPK